jgi:predicted phosphoribosyltransferase
MLISHRSTETRFRDRREAGQRLAAHLTRYAGQPDVLVLGLPRGGVPVAFEVARSLHAPLDVFVVRKLGVPGNPELAMGAIATGGVRVVNQSVVDMLGLSAADINAVAEREEQELKRREQAYRNGRPVPEIAGRTIILVDDGIATGSTIRAAIKALRQLQAGRIVVATPTAALESAENLRPLADNLIAVITPVDFFAVGQWYADFAQTTDDEVRTLLAEANPPAGRTPPCPPFPSSSPPPPHR